MPLVRQLEISNFRGIRHLVWNPAPGLNCLIGPGDSGKTTILSAIDIALSARRNIPFTDADFHNLNVDAPIEIIVSLGGLPDELINLDKYGHFLRGFDVITGALSDEPFIGLETILTIKLTVRCDLQPEWNFFSQRANSEGIEKSIPWAIREIFAPIKLDAGNDRHLAWGTRSILNKLSDSNIDISETLANVARQTRSVFDQQPITEFQPVLSKIKSIADNQGVSVGNLKALLDVNGVSLNNGAVSVHNSDNTPLRQLGTGSIRLLVSGIQRETSTSNIMLIDEAEYGLEPFRISKLLNNLGAKSIVPESQVFITTHSPFVLRELQAQQLWILRKNTRPPPPPNLLPTSPVTAFIPIKAHQIQNASSAVGAQATLRAEAESFFAKKVLVCEGKTEIGLVRGLDLQNMDANQPTWLENGVAFSNGDGGNMFNRAEVFHKLGYKTAIFKDSDIPQEHANHQQRMTQMGIEIIEWGNGHSTESAIFNNCPATMISGLLQIAIDRKGFDSVNSSIRNNSNNQYDYNLCHSSFNDVMRPVLALASGKKGWFKDIEPMELIGRTLIAPQFTSFQQPFQTVLRQLYLWLNTGA